MRAAVVIGVDAVGGGLPRLQAAASGAEEVADWLRRSDYRVSLFTDREAPVERSQVFRAVADLVDAGTVERLVVYFAGHGFLKGPVEEFWLLSGAPADAAEAVNVVASGNMARYRGIPEVVFISDACRVAPVSGVHSGIAGASVFPNLPPSPRAAEIDYFYATRPGDPAFERSGTEAQAAHGLFTHELLQAHIDAPQEALLTIGNRDYVRSEWLRDVLADRVNMRAEGISLRLTQSPDLQVQIRRGCIALNEVSGGDLESRHQASGDPPASETESSFRLEWTEPDPIREVPRDRRRRPAVVGSTRGTSGRAGTTIGRVRGSTPPGPWIVGEAAKATEQFQERVRIIASPRRQRGQVLGDGYEPRLKCVGDLFGEIVPSAGLTFHPQSDVDDDVMTFQLVGRASEVAVRFADGSGMLLPVIREFACEVVRHEGRTLAVNYSWLPYFENGVKELRAEVLAAATLGLLDTTREAASELARRLRRLKRFDPMLGLVSALAYVLAGDLGGAASVRDHMRRDLGIDLFDAWMLGGAGGSPVSIRPALPLLSQSWSLLDIFGATVPEDLRKLERVPGFWTVFERSAMNEVAGLVRNG
ncbi:caspase family protein [Sphingomonas sp. SAFR-052]|uniref:caspase family protein n=1 Tax=Sphingomonas sp. SAFR-052 TaxID=3436867 RepID=UPI003F81B587